MQMRFIYTSRTFLITSTHMKYIKIFFSLCTLCFLLSTTNAQTWNVEYTPTNVDMQKVKEARLSRHNDERQKLWLYTYTWSIKLDSSAQKRAEYLAQINKATHKRLKSDWYYNYNSIKSRFSWQNIIFPKEKSWIANFTENLAYQYYKCNKADCTQDLISALKKWFNFFMSEKKYKGPHYRAVISKQFKVIGMWIGIVWNRYYVVTHYGTNLTAN